MPTIKKTNKSKIVDEGKDKDKDKDKSLSVEIQVLPLVREAREIEITSSETLSKSAEYLSQLNTVRDKWIESKEELTKPINLALKEIRARYSPIEKMLDEAILMIRTEQSRYHTIETRRIREEEAKIAARVGQGSGNLKIETAIKKMDNIVKVEQKVVTQTGSVAFRDVQVLKITDEKLIPRSYLVIDESLLLRDLKAGEKIPGAEIEIISQPINRR